MRVALACLGLFAVACSDNTSNSPPAPSGWRVEGNAIRDPDGRTAILRGANVVKKEPPYFSFHMPADYQRMRDAWGMNSVRFIVLWAAIEPQKGQYDSAYLDAVAERMKWANDAGLLVVVDMHQDLYGEGFAGDGAPRWTCDEARYAAFRPRDPWFLSYLDPNMQACYDGFWSSDELQSHYAEAWRRLAARLKDNPANVGFDPMNEPFAGTYPVGSFEPDRLQPLYDKVIAAVRGEAPKWLAFVEPGSMRNSGYPTQLQPFGVPNIVYAPHSYDSVSEGGGGFDPATRRAPYMKNILNLADEAKALGAALWIGEYGGISGTPGIGPYMTAQYDADGMVAASAAYWAYDRNSGGYGMVNDDGSEKPVLDDVLSQPYPERAAGTLDSYAFDQATKTLTVTMHPDASIAAPTQVSIAPRWYPNGYSVECGGCTVEKKTGMALLTNIPGTGAVTITIH